MIWQWLGQFVEWLAEVPDQMMAAYLRWAFRYGGVVGLLWALSTQEWVPDLVHAVVVVPPLFGMLLCGGPVASYGSARYTEVVERYGGVLMAISASFAVGALIGLSILSGGPSPCDGRAWCLGVMWWAICTGAWTVLAGIWGMTRTADTAGAAWARETAARIVVGTTIVAAVLLAIFGLMFSGAI
ncbi:MAG: hypothetical protein OXI56_05595 [bacterium]|nr:hypothetical protein [bacterium]MDE0601251.1 hypothetical protein [bacterium]